MKAQQLVGMIHAVSMEIDAARDELNRLDSALGDGDHGTGVSAGFAEAVTKIAALTDPTPADIFKATGTALLNRMGGASGALYGTLFLKASAAVAGKTDLTAAEFAAAWRAGLDGVMERGKAAPGGKTMVDALLPAVDALESAIGEGQSLASALDLAADAARTGAEHTAPMLALFGRAKFAGERSVGHVDAGAESVAVMFAAMRNIYRECVTSDE